VRGSYGHSTRTPVSDLTQAIRIDEVSRQYWGDTVSRIANPELRPEQQQGWEGGFELYLGNRASLVVTRYNDTVDDLIAQARVDSADVLPGLRALYGCLPSQCWFYQDENLNLGSIRNQGWEVISTVTTGPVTTKGTYSWNKSRIIGMTQKYRNQFPQFVVGSPFVSIPEHTWALDLTYAHGGTSLSYNLQGQGMLYSAIAWRLRDVTYGPRLNAHDAVRVDVPALYREINAGYFRGDVHISHRLSSSVTGRIDLDNLWNGSQYDVDARPATLGRQVQFGLQLRL
jgi:outer membrane receptor protein involved in Fe transport